MKSIWKEVVSTLLGIIATFCQLYGVILGLVCMAIVFDTITGICAAKAKGIKVNSQKANQGFWKKIGLILALFFGMFLDLFIPTALTVINITLPFNMPFGLIFGCYIVFNESISICENFDNVNPTILPRWVKILIQGGVDNIDSKMHHDEEDDDHE